MHPPSRPDCLGLSLGQQPCTMAMNPNPVILPKSPTESPRAKGSDLFHLLPEFSDFLFFLHLDICWSYFPDIFQLCPQWLMFHGLEVRSVFRNPNCWGNVNCIKLLANTSRKVWSKKRIDLGIPWWAGLWSGGRIVPCHTGDSRVQTLLSKRKQIPNTRTRVISPAKWPNGHSDWMNQKQPVPSGTTVGWLAEFPWASLAMKKVDLALPKYAWYLNSPLK